MSKLQQIAEIVHEYLPESRTSAVILAAVLVFLLFNISMYSVVTVRLANNFSNVMKAKMIEVKDLQIAQL